jgi:hypothetical protein
VYRCGKRCGWQGPDLPQAGQRFAPGSVHIESVPYPLDEALGPLGGPRERGVDEIPDRLDVHSGGGLDSVSFPSFFFPSLGSAMARQLRWWVRMFMRKKCPVAVARTVASEGQSLRIETRDFVVVSVNCVSSPVVEFMALSILQFCCAYGESCPHRPSVRTLRPRAMEIFKECSTPILCWQGAKPDITGELGSAILPGSRTQRWNPTRFR